MSASPTAEVEEGIVPVARPAALRIELFGGIRVLGPTGEIRYRSEKTRLLAAYLALRQYVLSRGRSRGGARILRDRVLHDLWDGEDSNRERDLLSTELWWLRKEARAAVGAEVFTGSDGLEVEPTRTHLDVAEFDAALDRSRRSESPEPALTEAARLYLGPLLAGFDVDWCLDERERLRHAHWETCDRLCDIYSRRGAVADGLRLTSRWLVEDPLDERPVEWQIRFYRAAGRDSAARDAYERLATRLREVYDELPSARLQSLILRPASPSAIPSPAALPSSRGGPLGTEAAAYVERASDGDVLAAIQGGRGLVLLKGPSQSGKTSLLFRCLAQVEKAGWTCVHTDVNTLAPELARGAAEGLEAVTGDLRTTLAFPAVEGEGPAGTRLKGLLEAWLGRASGARLLWALDGLDLLMGLAHAESVFRVFRGIHVTGRAEPNSPLARLTIVMAYASEPHLYIRNLAASPFANVGTHVTLGPFSTEEVGRLVALANAPVDGVEIPRLQSLLGGRPGLTQRFLRELARGGRTFDELERLTLAMPGLFFDHVRPIVEWLRAEPGLIECLTEVARGQPCRDQDAFYRLRSAGILAGDHSAEARVASRMHEAMIRQCLEPPCN